MKFLENKPPRTFQVGDATKIQIKDCGKINLDSDEQVTFVTDTGNEYDVTRKAWGFYATPSINARLIEHGLRTALVKNKQDRFFILLVSKENELDFTDYTLKENIDFICWLDNLENLKKIEKEFSK